MSSEKSDRFALILYKCLRAAIINDASIFVMAMVAGHTAGNIICAYAGCLAFVLGGVTLVLAIAFFASGRQYLAWEAFGMLLILFLLVLGMPMGRWPTNTGQTHQISL